MTLSERYRALSAQSSSLSGVKNSLEKSLADGIVNKANLLKSKDTKESSRTLQWKGIETVKQIIDKMSQEHINSVKEIVTFALQTIFDDKKYSLEIVVKDSRGSKSVDLFLNEELSNGSFIVSEFEDGIGGGIKSVVGLTLQIFYIMYYDLERILFMDEALSNISSHYIPQTMEFLNQMSVQRGFKFVLVTHDQRIIEYGKTVYLVESGKVTRQL